MRRSPWSPARPEARGTSPSPSASCLCSSRSSSRSAARTPPRAHRPSPLPRTYWHRCGRLTGTATRSQVPSVLQPMVLSLSLEALVDRRTVQQVCQQAQLRKLLQSVQVRSRERARRARAHTGAPRRRAHAPECCECLAEAPRRLTTPPSRPCSECPIVRRSLPLVPIPWCRRRRAYTTRSAPPGWMSASCRRGRRR